MPVIILMMAMGLIAGFLLRHRRMAWVSKAVTALVWLLLLLLGVEVGGNGMIIGNLHRLGLNALIIAMLATAGSVAASVLLWRKIKSGTGDDSRENNLACENLKTRMAERTRKHKTAQPGIVTQQKLEEAKR